MPAVGPHGAFLTLLLTPNAAQLVVASESPKSRDIPVIFFKTLFILFLSLLFLLCKGQYTT